MTGIEPAFVHMDPGPQPGVYTYSTTYTVLLKGLEPLIPQGETDFKSAAYTISPQEHLL